MTEYDFRNGSIRWKTKSIKIVFNILAPALTASIC